MHALALLTGLAALQSWIAPASAETVLGLAVFSRHGDRTTRRFPGYGLTSLGHNQNYQVGAHYRSTYLSNSSPLKILGISEDVYVPSQIFASAPDQKILIETSTAFLQGLYPPINREEVLNNGSTITSPLGGYQYVFLRSEEEESPDTIWIKGDDGCPAYTSSADQYFQTEDFQATAAETQEFYSRMLSYLTFEGSDWTMTNMSYRMAYDIYDAIHVASIHNATSPARNVTSADLSRLHALASKLEYSLNANASSPIRSIGGQALAGAMLRQLNQTIVSRGRTKLSFFGGSYDTMLAFFSHVAQLDRPNFTYLPDYASTISFELLVPGNATEFPRTVDDIGVRFRFWNGSSLDSEQLMQVYPLFGSSDEVTPWTTFVDKIQERAVTSLKQWCGTCGSQKSFCLQYNQDQLEVALSQFGGNGEGLSKGAIGGISAVCGAVVSALACAAAFLLLKKKNNPSNARLAVASSPSSSTKELNSFQP
ncbi:phosphoglycerate mutase-like protein [Violaceomyces palustris]|uniref:Phosphoglycerate mutase-like protein n=1 Tax=Violaceomyces palustris TaxID=1673888 RepID=A0ACD0NQN0_9BASI|nr:phosphoglycerate mutase-like protein [Violaceomyces palustris]